tara:strand:- start:112 stop:675 length:564 start_codon:yes stop_codon:yes gene_type:complete
VNKTENLNTNGLTYISGPSSSGKSRWAENIIGEHHLVTYIATSLNRPEDKDWLERIRKHKLRRPSDWTIMESPINLSESLNIIDNKHVILIDSLGGYISSNLHLDNYKWKNESKLLINTIDKICKYQKIIIVSEEIAWSVVPSTNIGNKFRDRLSYLSAKLAKIANKNWLVVQGIAIDLNKIGYIVP